MGRKDRCGDDAPAQDGEPSMHSCINQALGCLAVLVLVIVVLMGVVVMIVAWCV